PTAKWQIDQSMISLDPLVGTPAGDQGRIIRERMKKPRRRPEWSTPRMDCFKSMFSRTMFP
ncbi:MAG: hypothetical protein N2C14_08985, partial [Planctomycetales bacterium]